MTMDSRHYLLPQIGKRQFFTQTVILQKGILKGEAERKEMEGVTIGKERAGEAGTSAGRIPKWGDEMWAPGSQHCSAESSFHSVQELPLLTAEWPEHRAVYLFT